MGGNILLVDDDPNVIEILTESLRGNGYETRSAADGEEAIAAFDRFQPDLVVLDVVLPKKDGFEVCDEIRARDINRDVPVIMISANSIQDSMLKGLHSGAQDYLKKPFSLKEMLAKIDNYLTQARRKKNLREQNLQLEDKVQQGHADYTRVDRELKKKILDMRSLFGLSQDLNRLRDPDELIHVFCLTVVGQLGVGLRRALLRVRRDGRLPVLHRRQRRFEARSPIRSALARDRALEVPSRKAGHHQARATTSFPRTRSAKRSS